MSSTVRDTLAVFSGALIAAAWPPSLPAAHGPLFAATRALGFPWLRLRPDFAVAGDADGWHAWLEGPVDPADLRIAQQRLTGFAETCRAGFPWLQRWVQVQHPRHLRDGYWEVLAFVPRGASDSPATSDVAEPEEE